MKHLYRKQTLYRAILTARCVLGKIPADCHRLAASYPIARALPRPARRPSPARSSSPKKVGNHPGLPGNADALSCNRLAPTPVARSGKNRRISRRKNSGRARPAFPTAPVWYNTGRHSPKRVSPPDGAHRHKDSRNRRMRSRVVSGKGPKVCSAKRWILSISSRKTHRFSCRSRATTLRSCRRWKARSPWT